MGMLYHINDNIDIIKQNCKTCKANNNFPICFKDNICTNDTVIKAKKEFIERYNIIKKP